jgi:hypothetical protein
MQLAIIGVAALFAVAGTLAAIRHGLRVAARPIAARALRHQQRLRQATTLPVVARAPIRYQDDAGTHPIPIPVPDAECGYCVPDDGAGPAGLHSWWRKPCICGQDCGFEYCRKRPHAITDSENES